MPRFIDVILFDTLADWEIGHALAHLNDPRWQVEPGRYQVRTAARCLAPIRTTGGLTIQPDVSVDALDPAQSALLLLPGGAAWDAGQLDDLVPIAERWLAAGVPVAAICGATAGLARAGLLDDRPHTSNAAEYLQYQPGYGGAAHYRTDAAVAADGLITAGSLAPVEFAHRIFAALELYPPAILAAWLGLFTTRDPRHFFALQAAQG